MGSHQIRQAEEHTQAFSTPVGGQGTGDGPVLIGFQEGNPILTIQSLAEGVGQDIGVLQIDPVVMQQEHRHEPGRFKSALVVAMEEGGKSLFAV